MGAGAIGIDVMDRHPRLPCWLNDADPAIAALWEATRTNRNELIERVRDFEPKVAAFDLFQRHINARAELPETAAEIVEFGFHQLAVSMTRWSGCGGGLRVGYSITPGSARDGQKGRKARPSASSVMRIA